MTGTLKLLGDHWKLRAEPHVMERAMEPFRQVEPVSGDGILGTGLGLPLTKALAEANRATFQISSEPQIGTVVEIVFPTTRVLAEDCQPVGVLPTGVADQVFWAPSPGARRARPQQIVGGSPG